MNARTQTSAAQRQLHRALGVAAAAAAFSAGAATEGPFYNYFGTGAGAAGTAYYNSFFGGQAGTLTTVGTHNSMFGFQAGYYNTTGTYNTFAGVFSGAFNTTGSSNTAVGMLAGRSNTAESNNSFFGTRADGADGITNATAIGFQAQVSQSNSLVLGATPGLNTEGGANSYVAVGMGTDRPAAPLHVKRNRNSTAELALLENASGTTANRVMLEMVNKGASAINFTDSAQARTWALRAGVNGSNVFDLYRVGGSPLVRVTGAGNMSLAGTLTQNSNVHDKTGIEAVDAQAVLGKLQALPIRRWRYKADEGSAHVGPMAQDFHAAFGLGADATKIAPGDMAGVALVAIQAQQQRMKAQDERLARLEAENEALRAQLRVLAATVGTPPRR